MSEICCKWKDFNSFSIVVIISLETPSLSLAAGHCVELVTLWSLALSAVLRGSYGLYSFCWPGWIISILLIDFPSLMFSQLIPSCQFITSLVILKQTSPTNVWTLLFILTLPQIMFGQILLQGDADNVNLDYYWLLTRDLLLIIFLRVISACQTEFLP